MPNRWGKMETVTDFIFLGFKISADSDCGHEIKIHLLLGRKPMRTLGSILKSRDITLLTIVYVVKTMFFFSSSHVWMWELDHKEGWMLKNWYFQIVLENTLESPLDSKEIKPVNPKGNQPWIFIGRTDAEGEAPIFWLPDANSWLIAKYPNAGEDWGQEEKCVIEDEMVGVHYWLNGHEFEQTPGDSKGEENVVCCSPWGHKELGRTEWLNNNKTLKYLLRHIFRH